MNAPTLVWLRRDLRLADNPALTRASEAGGPVIPVFILDPLTEAQPGAAARWRLGRALADLAERLAAMGSRLVVRRGDALAELRALAAETGARRVVWSRLYDADARARDGAVKAALKEDGIEAVSVNGSLLFEPWTVETSAGGFFKVYTPFFRSVRGRDVAPPLPAPGALAAPERWPDGLSVGDLALGAAMGRGAAVLSARCDPGEAAARARLERFIGERIGGYADGRDMLAESATSGLSEHLAVGEISARTIWAAARAVLERSAGRAAEGAETFLKELIWREFAYHLLYHSPQIATGNWRPEWDAFPWRSAEEAGVEADRWRRGETGVPVIDAAMREMYVTGRMHNRARMLVGSYLTKHLMIHWRVGEAWFRDCLTDWDIAANAMGWQWVAGSGPDAAPYFRIFNPETQAAKFDPEGIYVRRWVAELADPQGADAMAFFEAAPRAWKPDPGRPYPAPMIDLKAGRERALAAYKNRDVTSDAA